MEGKYQWLDLRNSTSGIYYPVLQAKKHAGRSTGNMMGSEIKTIGVIGAGQMGNGIAQVAAAAGYRVQLYDLSAERIETALATVNGNLARQVASSKIKIGRAHV